MRIVPAAALAASALILAACQSSTAPGVTASAAAEDSLPSVSSGHRPGPDILYAKPAVAPQLTNTGVWRAEPILVSGAVAYRDGEFLYQDFLFDDHGAMGVPDPNTPYSVGGYLFSPTAGTYTYPTDPKYANNAADLVEWRVKLLPDATAFRVTLNTLIDPEAVGFTIALADLGKDSSVTLASTAWPHGAGVSSPATHFVTVHGASGEFVTTGGQTLAAPSVRVDLERRQFDVRVPRSAWDPAGHLVGITVGVGLWDAAGGKFLAPGNGSATASAPGGASPLGAAIVNVGPRLDEPQPAVTDPVAPVTIGDAAVGGTYQARWWRERAQADALQMGDVSAFVAKVDFTKLAAGVNDDSGVPAKGSINRILASHYEFGQGLDPTLVCYDIANKIDVDAKCQGRNIGRLQPYALYIPDKPRPAKGYGLTLLLHSLSANYNQYADSKNQSQLGERGDGTLVITPAGRGPDGFYAGIPEADTFEVWADVARRYALDPDWTVVSGYSMGGFGTYRLLSRWPDLFARGFSTVGIPGHADAMVPNLRNTPLMAWNCGADELVNISDSHAAEQHLEAVGLRFQAWLFPAADHLTLATNDEYGPAADFLGTSRVDRDPPHVTFVVNNAEDNAEATAISDHAYWLSDVRARDATQPGTLDVRSEGFGVADAPVGAVAESAGALTGGSHVAMPYVVQSIAWGEAPAAPVANVLHITATNIAAARIDPRRARVSCGAKLEVQSDGPVKITLDGC